MNHTIEVKNVYKSFKNIEVLHDVSLQADKGSICGIIGRNGSGKTVLFKCICGFLQIDRGEIQIEGKAVRMDKSTLSNLGIIIESPGFLRHYSGYKNLEFLMGLNGKPDREKINDVLDLVGLAEQKNKKVGKYSMGMRQRLGIAQAIMEDQNILILDEPMNGLDNQGVEDMRQLLLKLKEKGNTILLASHNQEDIRQLCDSVYEMDLGRIQRK
ncbi:ABC transporter ATP-binding protein [Blautia sp.]|uniref:ABC transporter ATP-binding protein n=1 Tax=Blautia sp. TaxID=1955243 RepID=UPI00258EFAE6|nr:ATP-binding cassette domain-containing protein [Blautia sp.]